MANIFVIGDTHFNHANILTFKRADGSPLRHFKDVEEMDETLIANWNSVVRQGDKIYHLGDVCFKVEVFNRIMPRLLGHKRLVMGNHDTFDTPVYLKHFERVCGSRVLDHMLLTHIPVHPMSLNPKWHGNVHGHLHAKPSPAGAYFNASVEQINYTPISLEEVKRELQKRAAL